MPHSLFFALIAFSAGIGLAFPAGVLAQGIGLKLQRVIVGPPASRDVSLPVFVTADRLEGVTGQEVRAIGDAELRKGVTSIAGDRLKYATETDEVEALGNVRLVRSGDVMTGPALRYKVDLAEGVFDQPNYSLAPRNRTGENATRGHGAARQMEILGDEKYRMSDGTFSTCQPGNEDWYIRFGQLDLDYGRSLGVARSATVVFKDVTILATPWMEFSLNNERKSGFLPPSYGSTGSGGVEITAPYYWNIAPNRDATLITRVIAKRGLQLGTEFRYLEKTYRGEARYEMMPEDKAANRSRYALSAIHTYADGPFGAGWNINTVSDDAYFRDLSSKINITSQVNLMREGYLAYSRPFLGDGSASVVGRLQRYQTLQDPLAPIAIPYARLPQVNFSAAKQVLGGTDFVASGEYVDFAHPTNVIGKRTTAYPTLSLPLMTAGAYITPKIGYNWAHYELSRTAAGADTSITRAMRTLTVDSGMTFDRNVIFRGQSMVQTLEPRLYYVNIPYRAQNNIPLFDTGIADLNYSQIFSENSFSGNDRINDANQLTAAVTTRLLQPNGQELARAIVGQRYYFKNQEVTLNPTDTPRTYSQSDWLAAASGRLARSWIADTAIQYNARLNRTERFSVGTRYQPEVQKVMNLGYRYNRDILHQVDASAQWPLGGGWYGLGRLNFSLKDHKLIEGLAGFEYDGGCWIVRVVGQSFATGVGTSTNSVFLQLELNGFSRIGSNPLEALKRNISGYSQLNKPADPNRPLNFYD